MYMYYITNKDGSMLTTAIDVPACREKNCYQIVDQFQLVVLYVVTLKLGNSV